MQSIVKKVLDTVRPYKGAPIHVVHGDYNSRSINAVICTNGIPNNATASEAVTATYKREDGQSKTFSGASNNDGSVTVPIPQWAMEEDGYITAWITVSTAESSLSTMEFMIECHERSNVDGEISQEDPEYNDILSILARIADHDVRIEEAAKLAESATQNADRNDKRITNLEKRLDASLFVTDDSVAYSKIVPEAALPYAEISKIGGMSHPDAETNTLKVAKTTVIKSIGVNLANIQDRTETVKNSYYVDTQLGIRLDANSKYTISMDYEVVSTSATALSLGVGYGENAFQAGIFDKPYPNLTSGTLVVTITTPTKWLHSNKAWVRLVRGATPHNSTVKISNFMFVKGTVLPSSFVPYEESILSVPSDVQALDGYGRGVNGVYNNHIDLVEKSFNRVVSRKVFDGTETFSFYTNSLGKPYACVMWAGLTGRLANTPCAVSPPFEYTTDEGVINGTSGYKVWAHNLDQYNAYHYITIPVSDLGLTTSATSEEIRSAFKVWLADMYAKGTPYTIEWVLKEQIVTDISDILSDDNYIEVYKGGSVIAENNSGLAAPTTVTYQMKEEIA